MTERDSPLISVITAVYNGADYIAETIESVLRQDYAHYEHIIIDDGSTDDGATVAVLKQYPHLRWWSRENKGQYATQNEGIAAATGDLLVVISADDVFVTPDTFSRVIEYWRAHPGTDMIYGKTLRMDEHGIPLPNLEISFRPSRWLLKHIVYVQHCSLFVSTSFVRQHDLLFDPTFRYAGDWEWLNRLFKKAGAIGYIRQPFAAIRVHQNRTSRRSNADAIAAEHRRVSELHGGSYRLHVLMQHLVNYRGMMLLAWATLREKGPVALVHRLREWAGRRLFKRHSMQRRAE